MRVHSVFVFRWILNTRLRPCLTDYVPTFAEKYLHRAKFTETVFASRWNFIVPANVIYTSNKIPYYVRFTVVCREQSWNRSFLKNNFAVTRLSLISREILISMEFNEDNDIIRFRINKNISTCIAWRTNRTHVSILDDSYGNIDREGRWYKYSNEYSDDCRHLLLQLLHYFIREWETHAGHNNKDIDPHISWPIPVEAPHR